MQIPNLAMHQLTFTKDWAGKKVTILQSKFLMVKSSELFKSSYILDYVAHEIIKDFLKNSHFENMIAGFHQMCQNLLR